MGMKMNQKSASALLVIAAATWGGSFVASKICINSGMMPFEAVFLRFFWGSVLTGLVFRKQLRGFTPTAIRTGLLMGITTSCAYALEMVGLTTVQASKASFLTATNIVILSLMYCLVYRIRPTVYSLSAAVLAMMGVGVLSFTGGALEPVAVGDLLLLGAACMYAANNMLVSTMAESDSRIQVSFIQFSVTAALMGIMTLFQGTGASYTPAAIGAITFQVVFATVVCYILKNVAMKYVSAVRSSLILATESIFCAFLSAALLRESITLQMLFGSLLIGLGILIEILHPIQKKK